MFLINPLSSSLVNTSHKIPQAPSIFMKIYDIVVHSTTQKNTLYHIEIFKDPDEVLCDCKSGRIHGFCKHIKYYKHLITFILHENPGC